MTQTSLSDPGHHIPTIEYDERQKQQIIDFLSRVRQRFEHKPEVFEYFIKLLCDHTQRSSVENTISSIVSLFGENIDLIEAFNTLLPKEWQISGALRRHENIPTEAEPRSSTKQNAQATTRLNVMPKSSSSTPSTLPQSLSVSSPTPSTEKITEHHHLCKQRAQRLLEAIQLRYPSEKYYEFLKVVQAHGAKLLSLTELQIKVRDMFSDNVDILIQFDELLKVALTSAPTASTTATTVTSSASSTSTPTSSTSTSSSTTSSSVASLSTTSASVTLPTSSEPQNITQQTKSSLQQVTKKSKEKEKSKLHIVTTAATTNNNKNSITVNSSTAVTSETFNTTTVPSLTQAVANTRAHKRKEKKILVFEDFDISQVDLDQCERNGRSYVVLPTEAQRARCSGRQGEPLCQSVLNDIYMSIPNTQDGYFRESPKTPYEEVLFRLEDDQFELDRLIESSQSTVSLLEQIWKALKTRRIPLDEIDIETALNRESAVHMRCIKDLYRYRENEITIALRHDPEKAVSQILTKLKQKITEWRVAKEKIWNRIWSEVYRRNYIHSLDHRRFTWRAQEKKRLHPKMLVAEIKKLYYIKVMEGQHPTAHMKFTIQNDDILRDAECLILLTGRKILSKEEYEKLKNLTNFLGHFFLFEDINPTEERKTFIDSRDSDIVMYGDANFYVVIRLFEILLSRLLKAKEMASFDSSRWDWTKYSRPEAPFRELEEPPMFDLDYPSKTSDKDKDANNKVEEPRSSDEKIETNPNSNQTTKEKETVVEENERSQEHFEPIPSPHKDNETHESSKDEENKLNFFDEQSDDAFIKNKNENQCDIVNESSAMVIEKEKDESSVSVSVCPPDINQMTQAEDFLHRLNDESTPLNQPQFPVTALAATETNVEQHAESLESTNDDMNRIALLPTDAVSTSDLPLSTKLQTTNDDQTPRIQMVTNSNTNPNPSSNTNSNSDSEDKTNKQSRLGVRISNRIRNRLRTLWDTEHKGGETDTSSVIKNVINGMDNTPSNFTMGTTTNIDSYWGSSQTPDPFVRISNEEKYFAFLKGIELLLDGQIEQHEMEDRCLKMFGKESYMLYTIDMVLLQLVRQMRVLNETSKSLTLLSVFYEKNSKNKSNDKMDVDENGDLLSKQHTTADYFQTAKEILRHEQIFKFTFNKKQGTLSVLMTDPHFENGYFCKESLEKIRWIRYVQNFIGTETSSLEKTKHSVFLRRNIKQLSNAKMTEIMKRLERHNALECVFEADNFGIRYVRESEDYFHRRRPCSSHKTKSLLKTNELTDLKARAERIETLVQRKCTNQLNSCK